MKKHVSYSILTLGALSAFISGCGFLHDAATEDDATLQGTVFSGLVDAAEVRVISPSGDLLAGPVPTDSLGRYAIPVSTRELSDPFILEASGGTFIDEATGNALIPFGKLSAFLSPEKFVPDSALHLTPATTIIHYLLAGAMQASEADSLFQSAFGFAPDVSTKPAHTLAPQPTASTEERLTGLRAAVFSRLTLDLGLPPERQFDLLASLARDLSDSRLDGRDSAGSVSLVAGGELPEDIQNRFTRSLLKFREEHAKDLGLAPDQIGAPPFGKIAFTSGYRVEYIEGMMPAMAGKTTFSLKITDRETGSPLKGLAMQVMPTMHMATHQHSTPMGRISENEDGIYGCEIYYLMASQMNSGSMGYWELKVTPGDGDGNEDGNDKDAVYFHPPVKMGMGGGTVRVALKGVEDKVTDMGTATPRNYYLFHDALKGTEDGYEFGIFIATRETMMKFPSVATGRVLKDEDGDEWEVDSIHVAMSSDGETWIDAKEAGGGKWSASGLSGITPGVAGEIRVSLRVNGEQKTVDGLAPAADGANGYAVFTVSPE